MAAGLISMQEIRHVLMITVTTMCEARGLQLPGVSFLCCKMRLVPPGSIMCHSDMAAAASCNHVARGLTTPSMGVGEAPEGTRVAALDSAITPCIAFPCL